MEVIRLAKRCCVAAIGAVVVGLPATAETAAYTVSSCGYAGSGADTAWVGVNPEPTTVQSGDACGAGGLEGGLWAHDRLGPGPDPSASAQAYWTFTPPSGNRVTAVTYSRFLRKVLDGDYEEYGPWKVRLSTTEGTVLEACLIYDGQDECLVGSAGGAVRTFDGLDTAGLWFGIRCVPQPPFVGCPNGHEIHVAQAVMYASAVTVSDPAGPTDVSIGGLPDATSWIRGTFTATVGGADVSGIRRLRVLRDGTVAATQARSCDFTRTAPCETPGATVSSQIELDSAGWPDGAHVLIGRAEDAASNATDGAGRTVRTDNTAPPAVTPAADGSWSATSERAVTWTPPPHDGFSPYATAVVELCRDGRSCATTEHAAGATSATVPLPQDGVYRARVHLTDVAGNAAPGAGGTATLRRDTTAPAVLRGVEVRQAEPTAAERTVGWLTPGPDGGAPLTAVLVQVCGPSGCTEHGAHPQDGRLAVTLPEAGEHTITVRTADGAGNEGPATTVSATRTSAPVEDPADPAPAPSDPPPDRRAEAPLPSAPAPQPALVAPVVRRAPAGLRVGAARRVTPRTIRVSGSAARVADGQVVSLRLRLRDPRGRLATVTGRGRLVTGRFTATLRLPRALAKAAIAGRRVVATLPVSLTTDAATALSPRIARSGRRTAA